ncbi:RNB domain-containing ribonuclease [Pseudomonas amygdali]|uniref:Exoribonuclease II n=2 Tax=Pseudomonas amygdali pv. lachrymans TaxID=53707 RepID=A0ABR5KRK6_PSEAV|nr:RNB domain-containing ribonuclease [Pseudomonas amygdali]AXH60033.1 RNB domain-containing ribonuclease [Pseudomonas amygdali pv. lachrymans str. M301315]KPC17436.1 Exoribonuclease II [Pseudomonas amygdali pv. lachrymans]RMT06376.1 Exoribonuclease II [Pseudomonas amygdali pv. lachrymans]
MFKNNAALMALKAQMQVDTGQPVADPQPKADEKNVISGRVEFFSNGAFLFTDEGVRYPVQQADGTRCLPGDLVEAILTPGGVELALVRLVEAKSPTYIGTVRYRGEHRFIQAEDRRIKQNFFIPHSGRGDEIDGDIVLAKVTRHPFENGKSAAVVEQLIAHGDDKAAIWKLALFRMKVGREYPAFETKSDTAPRTDLTKIPFVTIDGESSRDLDDALYAKAREGGGWDVWVAIADPDTYLMAGSDLDLGAFHRGATSYLPGMITPMLPHELSEDTVSLNVNQDRPVLVAKLVVGEHGDIVSQHFELATIRSQSKLSYMAVNDYLSGETDMNKARAIKESLRCLYWFSKARQKWRQSCALVHQGEDADYRLDVSDHQVNKIVKEVRNDAHKLVEEAMVAANIAFAQFADQHGIPVLSRVQQGFHPKALEAVNHIAEQYGLPAFGEEDHGFDQTFALLKAIQDGGDVAHQLRVRSAFQPSVYAAGGYHASLGLKRYATFTSPIRKYADLINHRQMKAYLLGEPVKEIDAEVIATLNERNKACVQGEREVIRKLYARHFTFLAGQPLEGVVIGIRKAYLDVLVCGAKVSVQVRFDNLEGFQDVDNDPAQLSLILNGKEFVRLGDSIKVEFDLRSAEYGELKGRIQAVA